MRCKTAQRPPFRVTPSRGAVAVLLSGLWVLGRAFGQLADRLYSVVESPWGQHS